MATKIEMAANALILLGDNPITSFDEQGAGAEAMANLYETTYLDLLTQTHWGFARKQQLLSQNVVPPVFDTYRYSYNLPAEQIAIYGLRSNLEYHLYEGGLLYTNDSNAELDFFIRPNEGDLPPYFVKLMEVTLASRACMAVTQDPQLDAIYETKASNQLLIAMGIDAQNDTNEAVRSSPFTEVRG